MDAVRAPSYGLMSIYDGTKWRQQVEVDFTQVEAVQRRC